MPELPEIVCRAQEMNESLAGCVLEGVEVLQPKCLNVSEEEFRTGLSGAKIRSVTDRGKWIFVETTNGHLLLNLGMGGEILLVPRDRLPKTWRIRIDLDRQQSLAINYWWFGYAHFVTLGGLKTHAMTAKLGPSALEVTREQFARALLGRRGGIKAFLLNQRHIAGIGNAYIHDILFRAGIHPLRKISALDPEDVERLRQGIRTELDRSIAVGGASYELNLYGESGGFTSADLLVGYREGKACPTCGATIQKIKTGATSSFICPDCQVL